MNRTRKAVIRPEPEVAHLADPLDLVFQALAVTHPDEIADDLARSGFVDWVPPEVHHRTTPTTAKPEEGTP